ncbi:S-methylmethionine permease mmp1 [Saccharomyces pastorianus]|uniref:S-methylmethionine permease mmp1 n=2 Tax=Saccharomyces TaxID=4930 RepID=A0A6C1E6A5_SACPS|nr:S-methylmethionine permease mmp1 [Saccharomyces pastorianus]
MIDSKSAKISEVQFSTSVVSTPSSDTTNLVHRFKNSFKRKDALVIQDGLLYSELSEEEKVRWDLANQPYKKVLDQRHLTMIAIGGTLGTGLFIGLGESLASGPASLLIGFLLVGASMLCVVQCGAELSCQYPVSGSYALHASRFIDPSVGFSVGINYLLMWLISFPSELVGCSLTMSYWAPSVNPAVWVAIAFTLSMLLNLFGARGFAESEFYMSIFKIVALFIFIIIGIILVAGGGPESTGYIGTKYWHDPGSFAPPAFKNFCNTFVSAAYSFSGTEMVVLTSAEARNVSSVSRAAKGTFWRIAVFYIVTVIIIGCLVPYNDPRLINGSSSEDITASPFVIALSNTGAMGTRVSQFMNAVILIAVFSVCNSCVYASSRLIQGLATAGQLPKICGYMDRNGRPLVGMAICGAFGLLGFLVVSKDQGTVFTWLFALCSISFFTTWFCICFCQIRFRMAMKAQGKSDDDIIYKSPLGICGGVVGCTLNVLLVIGEIYVSAAPVGMPSSAANFFEYCMSIPIMIAVYIGHRIYRKDWRHWYIKREDIDLDSGHSMEDLEATKLRRDIEKEYVASRAFYYRIYRFFC